jgi:hypothetical protein
VSGENEQVSENAASRFLHFEMAKNEAPSCHFFAPDLTGSPLCL